MMFLVARRGPTNYRLQIFFRNLIEIPYYICIIEDNIYSLRLINCFGRYSWLLRTVVQVLELLGTFIAESAAFELCNDASYQLHASN